MLDTTTKQKIDSLRNLLVGKVPDPKSQVEQITVALFYKFMWDRDKEIKDLGGNATFFVGKFKKYSWENLFSPDLGGSEFIKLYSEAIEEMEKNPNIPSVFRDIFKRAFLPYKDPFTLRLFLKEINDFHYSNSEKLGDGFEYLLSILGTQGDAGQFRTPRHIIDFVTGIVNPQKKDRICDPACGTAGFIISAYKHILKTNTKESLGDLLTPEDKKRLGNNLVGLDIDPMMVKLALANMYLHGLNEPHIYEYDSLTSEERWDDMFDVVLANPPFMTPSGGIRPHKRFAVNATKAEVLFTSYINTHLSSTGRAGVIVPEGIIFVGGNAYKDLRKQLIESSLIGVISLPGGVFKPYSGVKTSVLILDKKQNKKTDKIFFCKINNDGFDLGDNRNPIDKNDLPQALLDIRTYINSIGDNITLEDFKSLSFVSKNEILGSNEITLNLRRYQKTQIISKFVSVSIKDIASVQSGNSAPQNKKYFDNGSIPFIRTSDVGKLKFSDNLINTRDYVNEECLNEKRLKIFNENTILLPKSGASTYLNHRVMMGVKGVVASHLAAIVPKENLIIPKLLLYLLTKVDAKDLVNSSYPSLKKELIEEIKIPLPPLEIQKGIVEELEQYQKVIDGAKQVIENYKPTFEIDSTWKMIELGEMATTQYGTSEKSSKDGIYAVLRMGNLQGGEIDFSDLVYSNNHDDFIKLELHEGDILFNRTNSPELVGKTSIFRGHSKEIIFAGYLVRVIVNNERLLPEFLNVILNSAYGQKLNNKNVSISGNQANINATKLRGYLIPTPPLGIQKSLVEKIEIERTLVNSNKKLIEIYSKKIENRINSIWGE